MYQVNFTLDQLQTVMAAVAGRARDVARKAIEADLPSPSYVVDLDLAFGVMLDAEARHRDVYNLSNQEIAKTLMVMRNFGGHFCQHLADLYGEADPDHRATLLQTFRNLFDKYGPDSSFYGGAW